MHFFFIFLTVFLFTFPAQAQGKECVVLLHGMARSTSAMVRMEKALVTDGYRVNNIGYPSRKYSIDALIKKLHEPIQEGCKGTKKMHMAGHSMGGLLIRAYIKQYNPENLGRVVMIGTPNQGSEIADFLKNNYLYKEFFGPAGQQLVTDQSGFEELFGPVHFELGVIAGNRTIDPFSSIIIPGDDDGKVSIKSTKLDGMTGHIVVPAIHTIMPDYQIVIDQTRHFLSEGKFYRK